MNDEAMKGILDLTGQMYSQIISFMLPVFAILIIVLIVIKVREKLDKTKYLKTTYYSVTHLPYKKVIKDLGRYGEYLVYMNLRNYEQSGAKFLFNVYVPKENGETSEIDVLMISPKGLFVFESKNYSGWIFGDEKSKTWTQTLPNGRRSQKEHFCNPVKQNDTHIKNLKAFLKSEIPCYSIITFSQRCTLKKVSVSREDVHVINRDKVEFVVNKIYSQNSDVLNEKEIEEIYDKLYPLTQVSEEVKDKHINDIENNFLKPERETENSQEQSEETAKENNEAQKEKAEDEKSKIIEFYDSVLDEEEPSKDEPEETKDHICPKCGGKLVLRTARKGERAGQQFYGCENYPKCKYIENL